jgi:PPE-repeat protein
MTTNAPVNIFLDKTKDGFDRASPRFIDDGGHVYYDTANNISDKLPPFNTAVNKNNPATPAPGRIDTDKI